MSADNFDGIARQVRHMTEQVHLHVTGEPLFHLEFPRIIQIYEGLDLPVEITTNGTLMRTANSVVRQVNISMHAFSRINRSASREVFDSTQKAFVKRPDLYMIYRLCNLDTSQESLKSEKN